MSTTFITGPQSPLGSTWFDVTETERARFHGAAIPTVPPPSDQLDAYIFEQYYDLGLAEYAVYARTGDPVYRDYARKAVDSWWQIPNWIGSGNVRRFPDEMSPPPRHAGLGGLILRAMDGRPEMWDWINAYTRAMFDNWLFRRLSDPQLFYGVREGAFSLQGAVWLAKVLPDSFPLQAGGTVTNGAQLRAQYLADSINVANNYYARLQQVDGSWRWDDPDYTDSDGGKLKGITQPFMVGLLLHALIDLHILTGNTTVANTIVKGARHLYFDGLYRKDEAVIGWTGKRWRSFWYFYHGGTTVNPTKYEKGGGSYVNLSDGQWVVGSERQANGIIVPCLAYAYKLTGDPLLKSATDEVWDSAYGGSDGIHNLIDAERGKEYNQNLRRAGSTLVWVQPTAPVPPDPTPPTPVPTPPATRKVAWPTQEGKQDQVVAAQWAERYRFKRNLSGAYAEFEKVD